MYAQSHKEQGEQREGAILFVMAIYPQSMFEGGVGWQAIPLNVAYNV